MIKEHNVQVDSQRKAYLDEWVIHYRSYATKGQNATYIPALGKVNSSQLGISIMGSDGTMIQGSGIMSAARGARTGRMLLRWGVEG